MSAELSRMLVGTSRTFAAAIPLLEEPLATHITVAYLLLRIADTFEDAETWPVADRVDALTLFENALRTESCPPLTAPPGFDDAHRELLANAPTVFAALAAFPEDARAVITKHVMRTSIGMREFLSTKTGDRGLTLSTAEELYAYCYVVAGIVGELLTDLFLLSTPSLASAESGLREDAAAFGEALQLVNILKDRSQDASEGRRFIQKDEDLPSVFERARADCKRANTYTLLLEKNGASSGVLSFTRFPLRVAEETLTALEQTGSGAKIGRDRVLAILDEVRRR